MPLHNSREGFIDSVVLLFVNIQVCRKWKEDATIVNARWMEIDAPGSFSDIHTYTERD
jgi:hypothetical protein